MWFNPDVSFVLSTRREGIWEEVTEEIYQEKLLEGYDTKRTKDGVNWYNEIDIAIDTGKKLKFTITYH